ncbi:hypothetical protein BDFG_09517 [Blastomyces dermatitidis ATCC 26199]|nr:hypothetical protein BDFG_09517 [Blastomyces dermatitidis ATCC 26199]
MDSSHLGRALVTVTVTVTVNGPVSCPAATTQHTTKASSPPHIPQVYGVTRATELQIPAAAGQCCDKSGCTRMSFRGQPVGKLRNFPASHVACNDVCTGTRSNPVLIHSD